MLALPAPLREAIEARGSGLTDPRLAARRHGRHRAHAPGRAARATRASPHAAHSLGGVGALGRDPEGPPRPRRRRRTSSLGAPRTRADVPRVAVPRAREREDRLARLRALRAGLVLDFHGDLRTGSARPDLRGARPARVRRSSAEGRQPDCSRPTGSPRGIAAPRASSATSIWSRALGLPVRPVPDAGIAIAAVRTFSRPRTIVRPLVSGDGAYAILNPGASRRQAYKKPPALLVRRRRLAPWPRDGSVRSWSTVRARRPTRSSSSRRQTARRGGRLRPRSSPSPRCFAARASSSGGIPGRSTSPAGSDAPSSVSTARRTRSSTRRGTSRSWRSPTGERATRESRRTTAVVEGFDGLYPGCRRRRDPGDPLAVSRASRARSSPRRKRSSDASPSWPWASAPSIPRR